MSARAGVGFSDIADSESAGLEAARAALESAGPGPCDVALLFSTARHDQRAVLRSVRSVLGPDTKLVGGGAAGIITNDRLGYEGAQVGVAVLRSRSIRFHTCLQTGLAGAEERVGRAIGADVASADLPGSTNLVVMYESVNRSTPKGPAFNMGTPFLQGLERALGKWPPTVGLAFHGNPQWKPGHGYYGDRLEPQSAMALAISGQVRMDTLTITNLKPMSTYRTVTRTDGAALLELDGRRALDVVADLVGHSLRAEDYPINVTLGVNRGEKFGDFREEEYAVHLCVAVDAERHALITDPYLRPGVEVQLMRRHIDLPDIRRRAEDLVRACKKRRPFFAFYIDCIGRASSYSGTEGEEAAEVQAAVGDAIPLFGIYSGGEIGSLGGRVQRLTNAGILSIFSEPS